MSTEAGLSIELSVVIPSHEDAACLELTLRSLRRQSLALERFEVIVVRDGGDAGKYAGVADAGKGLNLRYVELDERRGRGGARNEGVRHATSPLLLFLDADSYATPDLVQRHLTHHLDPSAPAVLMGRRDESGIEHVHAALADEPTIPAPRRRVQGGGDLRFGTQEISDDDDWLRAGWVFCFTHNVSVSRTLFDAVGGFTEGFGLRWGLEDMELFYRVHAHLGVLERNFAYDDLAAVYHLPHHRNLANNWNDFMGNLEVIGRQYPVVDWEFVGPLDLARSSDRIVHYRAAIADCVRRSACRIAPAVEELAARLPGHRVLWVGTGSAEAQLPEGSLTFDYGAPLSPTNFHLIGMRPPIEPQSLDAVVSVDFWRYLHWEDLCQFVNAAATLAGEVHLVSTGEELSAPFTPAPATLDYLRQVLDAAFETSLLDVDGFGLALRLIPRHRPAVAAD
ncbi:glycosyltransferase family 2 protein [Micromonospora zamorensis]|uniref:glycosyltransferase family 2 protein n=1 Tax=Micromonospora zamorensis TaxID=709883 RepID=UPI00379D4062